jgi:hypothetical protein
MKLIGVKRALMLAILLAVNLAIAGLYFFVIEPMRGRASTQLAGIESQINGLQSKIQNVKRELDDFKKNLPRYEELNKVGFFNNQDRFELRRHLDEVKAASAVGGFTYTVSEIKQLQSADASASKSRLINSRIEVKEVKTLVDSDFYAFIDAMLQNFPAHVRLHSFSVERKGELNNDTMRDLRTGKKQTVVEAGAAFDWFTIVPAPADETKTGWGGKR